MHTMKHIGTMSAMFDNVVSRDQVLKERVIECVGLRTGIALQNKQVIIGQTMVIIQHITHAERTLLQDITDEITPYCNANEHGFVLQSVLIR